nr:MAG TPA: hypothetical protein [Caudoviricetes sp.]
MFAQSDGFHFNILINDWFSFSPHFIHFLSKLNIMKGYTFQFILMKKVKKVP